MTSPDPPSAPTDPARRLPREPRVVIDGVGLLTPLGHSAWATFNALRSGRTLADRIDRLPESIEPVGLVRSLGGVSLAQHVARDPTVELAERATREAATQAHVSPERAPLWLGTSKGAVQALVEAADLTHHQRFKNPEAVSSDAWLAGALGPHQYLATQLARRTGSDMAPHHVAACASSLTALHHAADHLRNRASSQDNSASANSTSAISNQTWLWSPPPMPRCCPPSFTVTEGLACFRH